MWYRENFIGVLEVILSRNDIHENLIIYILNRVKKLRTGEKILYIPSNLLLLASSTNNIKIVKKVFEIVPKFMKVSQLQYQNSIHLNALDQSLMNRPFRSLIALEILKEIESLKDNMEMSKCLTNQSLYLAVKTNDVNVVRKLLEIIPRAMKKEMLSQNEGILETTLKNVPQNIELIEEILSAIEGLAKSDIALLMGGSVLYLATCSQNLEVFRRIKDLLPGDKTKYLYNVSGKENCLHAAIREANNSDMIKEILLMLEGDQRTKFVKQTTIYGSNALHHVMRYFTCYHIDNIKTILQMIPPKARTDCLQIKGGVRNYTPMHLLVKKHSNPANDAIEMILSMIDTIEEIKSLLIVKNYAGKTLLDYADSSAKEVINKSIAKKRLEEKEDSSSRAKKKTKT